MDILFSALCILFIIIFFASFITMAIKFSTGSDVDIKITLAALLALFFAYYSAYAAVNFWLATQGVTPVIQ